MTPATAAPHPLIVQMLAWLTTRTRTYDETLEAWRTSCPRFSIWEDALADRLIQVTRADAGDRRSVVELTTAGQALLDRFGRS